MRVLEAKVWAEDWQKTCREAGISPDLVASLLFAAAALQQHEQGAWLMEVCVDAKRKLGCSHGELAFVLGDLAQRHGMIQIGRSDQHRPA